jgi:hypothetical protein
MTARLDFHGHTGAHTNELVFIEHMGRFSNVGAKLGRAEILRRYIDACSRRVDWKGIKRADVILFAKDQLAKEVA